MSFFAASKGHWRNSNPACRPEVPRVLFIVVLVSLLVPARFVIGDTVSMYGDTIDAIDAAGRYVDGQIDDADRTESDASKQIRESRFLDAFWYLGADDFNYSTENAAKSAQETSLISTTGEISNTVYGGPPGAAAYAAWYSYEVTGNFELALRVGMIAGTRRAASSAVETDPAGQLAQKAMIAGAVGGMAVAAGGGDVNALVEGFLKSGGMVLVQDGYRDYTEDDQDTRQSIPEAYCIMANPEWSVDSSQTSSCLLTSDADVRDANVNGAEIKNTEWIHERGSLMTTVSDVSRLHDMTGFRDHWAVSWNMSVLSKKMPRVPAVVMTYMGTTTPLDNTDSTAVARQLKLLGLRGVEGHGSVRVAEYSCDHAGMSRSIAVDKGGVRTDYACRVVYDTDDGLSVLWTARNDADYCGPKADSVIDNLLKGGWSCSSRELQADVGLSVTAFSENPFVPEIKLLDVQEDPKPDEQEDQQPEEQNTSKPDRQYPISSRYECYKAGAIRTVYVEHGNSDEAFSCRVVHESEDDTAIAWTAQNDWKNCGPMAIALARKFQDYGWRCS